MLWESTKGFYVVSNSRVGAISLTSEKSNNFFSLDLTQINFSMLSLVQSQKFQ